MPQTSGFRSGKQILVVSLATQARAFILSDHSIFYTHRGGGEEEQRRGLMPLGLFLLMSITCFLSRGGTLQIFGRGCAAGTNPYPKLDQVEVHSATLY